MKDFIQTCKQNGIVYLPIFDGKPSPTTHRERSIAYKRFSSEVWHIYNERIQIYPYLPCKEWYIQLRSMKLVCPLLRNTDKMAECKEQQKLLKEKMVVYKEYFDMAEYLMKCRDQ